MKIDRVVLHPAQRNCCFYPGFRPVTSYVHMPDAVLLRLNKASEDHNHLRAGQRTVWGKPAISASGEYSILSERIYFLPIGNVLCVVIKGRRLWRSASGCFAIQNPIEIAGCFRAGDNLAFWNIFRQYLAQLSCCRSVDLGGATTQRSSCGFIILRR